MAMVQAPAARAFRAALMVSAVSRALQRRRLATRNRALIHQLEDKIQELLAILREHAEESNRLTARPPDR